MKPAPIKPPPFDPTTEQDDHQNLVNLRIIPVIDGSEKEVILENMDINSVFRKSLTDLHRLIENEPVRKWSNRRSLKFGERPFKTEDGWKVVVGNPKKGQDHTYSPCHGRGCLAGCLVSKLLLNKQIS